MLRFTFRQLVDSQGSLAKLIGGTDSEGAVIKPPSCSPRLAYSLWLLRKGAVEQFEFFEGKRAELTAALKTDDVDKEKLLVNFTELLDTQVRLANVGRIAVTKLEAEGIMLTPFDFAALDWLLKVDVEPIFELDVEEDANG